VENAIRACYRSGSKIDIEGIRVIMERMERVVRKMIGISEWWRGEEVDRQGSEDERVEGLGESEGEEGFRVERQDIVIL
jgi:hypothetical protein